MIQTREQLKQWFKKYAYPTERQFWGWIDSFWHKDDAIPAGSISGLQEVVDGVAEGINDAINELKERVDEPVTVELQIHAFAGYIDITEDLTLTAIRKRRRNVRVAT